jgi:hypothetical protein
MARTPREIGAQPLKDDDVGDNDQAGFGVGALVFQSGVEILPGDGQGDDFGFAAASSHFDAVAGIVVVLQEAQPPLHHPQLWGKEGGLWRRS